MLYERASSTSTAFFSTLQQLDEHLHLVQVPSCFPLLWAQCVFSPSVFLESCVYRPAGQTNLTMHGLLRWCGRPHARVCSTARARTDAVVPVWVVKAAHGWPQRRGSSEQAQVAHVQADDRPRRSNASTVRWPLDRPSFSASPATELLVYNDLFNLPQAYLLSPLPPRCFTAKRFLVSVGFLFLILFLYLLQTRAI
jgi:hypothetical protein